MDLYDGLMTRLINGDFAPGEKLKPNVLAVNFGVSASATREALFRLSTVGLVDFEEQKGFRAPKVSYQLQHELTLMRILLECEGACLSIHFGGVAWEARLTAAHHKLSHIESLVRDGRKDREVLVLWTDAELEFHQTLIDACRSDLLIQTHLVVYQRFRQQLITTDRQFVFVPENVEQHKGILEASLNGELELVRERITDHLSRNLINNGRVT